jgi:hypothetical protein
MSMAIHSIEPGAYRLGPIMGVLVTYAMTRKGPWGPQMTTYVEIMKKARQVGGMAFVFKPSACSLKTQKVRGWTYHNQRWIPCLLPLPNVVYNRIASPPLEKKVRGSGLLRGLEKRGIKVFNPHYLNKWGVHRALSKNPDIRPYLPETHVLRSLTVANKMLAKYGRIFMKPLAGSLGLGAIQVIRRKDRRLSYKMNTLSGRKKSGVLSRVSGLGSIVPKKRYVVQRDVHLATIKGRPFDVRVLIQKGVNGKWLFTGAAARVAGKGRITTHVPRGGSRLPLDIALNSVFSPDQSRLVMKRLEEVCTQAGYAIEASSRRMFGELSLDVGVDHQGNVWILEVNAKPFRFDEPQLRRRAQQRLIQLVFHLSGCSVPNDQEMDGNQGIYDIKSIS